MGRRHWRRCTASPAGAARRTPEHRDAGEGFEAAALFCTCDLYEQEHFTAGTCEFLRLTFFTLTPMPVFIAPGNHDWYGPARLYAPAGWSPNVHVHRESALDPRAFSDALPLSGAGHRATANTQNFLDGFRVDAGRTSRCFTHAELARAEARVHRHIAPVLRGAVIEWLPRFTDGRYTECLVATDAREPHPFGAFAIEHVDGMQAGTAK